MSLAEKDLAERLVDWRQQHATGSTYIDITEAIDTFQAALDALQAHRATIARLADTIESLATGPDRAGRAV